MRKLTFSGKKQTLSQRKLLISAIAVLSNNLNHSQFSSENFTFCNKTLLTAAFINERSVFLLGLIIQSMSFNHDSLLIEIGNLKENSRVVALTGT